MFIPCFKKGSWFKSSSGAHAHTHTHTHTHASTLSDTQHGYPIFSFKEGTVTVLEQSYLWRSHSFLFLGLIHWICRMLAQIYEEKWNKMWDRFPMKVCHILTAWRLFYFISYSFFAGSAMLFLFTYILTWLRWWVYHQPRPQNYSNIILWKALVLSHCGKFLMIPSLIWGEIGTETHSLFIMGYIFLSQLKVYSGKCIFYSILDMWYGKLLLCVWVLVFVQFVFRLNTDSSQICLHMTVIQWSCDHHLHPNGTVCIHVIDTDVLIVRMLQIHWMVDSNRITSRV